MLLLCTPTAFVDEPLEFCQNTATRQHTTKQSFPVKKSHSRNELNSTAFDDNFATVMEQHNSAPINDSLPMI